MQEGWPAHNQTYQDEFQPYERRQNELSMEGVCVLWGNRVVVPKKGRKQASSWDCTNEIPGSGVRVVAINE